MKTSFSLHYTMKNSISLLLLGTLLLTASCKKDFLQRDPGVPISEEDVFKDPVLAARFADNSYNFLLDDYGRLEATHKGTTGQFTDEAIFSGGNGAVTPMNQGNFDNPNASDVAGVYTRMYQGIRNVNVMISKIDSVPWTDVQSPGLIKAQMHFLRGFFYFELVKRYGGVILLDKAIPLSENKNTDLPRSTFEETVTFILDDLRIAEGLFATDSLANVYTPRGDWNAAGHYGRPTVGAVKALRSRLLLLVASPLHNPNGDPAKWKNAANAAKEIMDMGKYSLHTPYATLLTQATSPEYIMIKVRPNRNSTGGMLGDFVIPPSWGGGQGQLNPTQNHVDLYETSKGKFITDPTSGYNPQDPYKDRDPRLTNNVLYNDVTWQNRKMEMWTVPNSAATGLDYKPTSVTYTRTRYYCRKLWPPVYRPGSTNTSLLNFVFFRYGETLLNYAEALNEAEGPTSQVYEAIRLIRVRAGMQALPANLSKDQMRERIHNERAVELAFEEHRWWDLLRWKKGQSVVAQPVYAMNVFKVGNTFIYNPELLPASYQRVFTDRMYLYPIPRLEIQRSTGILEQNPGW